MRIRSLLLTLVILLCFLIGVANLEQGRRTEGRRQLEDALRRAAVSCYAAEGFYPPDVAYLQTHYALRYEEQDYLIHYGYIASNLMPDITVLEK